MLLLNTTPRSLEEAGFSEFRLFLLRRCGLPTDRYLLLLKQSDSKWEDKVDEYHFANIVANYKLVFPGANAIFFHYANNRMLFDGYGQISSVNDMGEDGKTKKGMPIIRKVARHDYKRLGILESKSSEIEDRIRKLPKFNIQNSIRRIPKSIFDSIINELSPESLYTLDDFSAETFIEPAIFEEWRKY